MTKIKPPMFTVTRVAGTDAYVVNAILTKGQLFELRRVMTEERREQRWRGQYRAMVIAIREQITAVIGVSRTKKVFVS